LYRAIRKKTANGGDARHCAGRHGHCDSARATRNVSQEMNTNRPIPSTSHGLSRRRWPRFETRGRIHAQIAVLDLAMTVRDVSLGGFAVEAPVRFAHGESYEFQLQCSDHPPVTARARAVYCHVMLDRTNAYITGWEALGDPATTQAMARLVDDLTATDAESTDAGRRAPTYNEPTSSVPS
jgi:hypothetical protein